MKKIIFLLLVTWFSQQSYAQTIYFDVLPAEDNIFYNGDYSLESTALDLVYLFNKSMAVTSFNADTLDSSPITSGIVLKLDTNLLYSRRLQSCDVTCDGLNLLTFTASTPTGIRFGVYSYLNELGFKFYGSDSLWEVIPALNSPYIPISDLYETRFQFHSFTSQGDFGPSPLDNAGVAGLPWHLYRERNTMVHEYDLQGHVGEGWVADDSLFLATNPCYIAEYNGAHEVVFGAMPSVQSLQAKQHWSNYIFSLYNNINVSRSPWMRGLVTVEAADGTRWGNTSTSCGLSPWGTPSEQSVELANFASNELNAQFNFPFKTSVFAYSQHYDTTDFVINTLLQVGVTFGWQNETTPVGLLHRWHEKHPNKTFEYDYLNLPDGTYQSPFADLKYLGYQAKRCNAMHTLGYTYEGTWGVFPMAMYMNALNQSLQDETDIQDNLNVMIDDMYAGSAPKIKELFGYWSNSEHWSTSSWLFNNMYRMPLYLSLINDANAMSSSPEETSRLNMLKSYVHYLALLYDEKFEADQATKWAKTEVLLDYMASIYHSGIINSLQGINVVLSADASPSTINDWYNSSTNQWNDAAFLAPTAINDAQIEADFIDDLVKFPVLDNFNLVSSGEVIDLACDVSLIPQDTIDVTIYGYYPAGTTFKVKSFSAGSIRIFFNKLSNNKVNFVLDSEDQLYSKTITGDTVTASGFVDFVIPEAGNYSFYVMYPNTCNVELKIVTNGNYFYHSTPIYYMGTEKHKNPETAPKHFYVPEGLTKLYFAMPYTNGDTTLFVNSYHFKDALGNVPQLFIEPSDSNLYYFEVDAANSGKFWELYVDTLASWGYTFSFVNIENGYFYFQDGSCELSVSEKTASIDLVIIPNPSNGNVKISFSGEGETNFKLYDIIGQLHYKRSVAHWESSQQFDFSQLPNGIYLVQLENNGQKYTRRLAINH